MAKTSLVQKQNDFENAIGIKRMLIFLKQYNQDKFNEKKYLYLFKYAERYTLIKRLNNVFQIDTQGANLLKLLTENLYDEVKIAELLKNILLKNRSGCGSWVTNEDAILDEQYFKFEANSKSDVNYKYSLFLFDLGLIVDCNEWLDDLNNLWHCKKTNLGQELTKMVKLDYLTKFNSVKYEDNSNKNFGVAGKMVAGKKI